MIMKIGACFPNNRMPKNKCTFGTNLKPASIIGQDSIKSMREAIPALLKKVENVMHYDNFTKKEEKFLIPAMDNLSLSREAILRVVPVNRELRSLEVVCYDRARTSWTPRAVIQGLSDKIISSLNDSESLAVKLKKEFKQASDYLYDKSLDEI